MYTFLAFIDWIATITILFIIGAFFLNVLMKLFKGE